MKDSLVVAAAALAACASAAAQQTSPGSSAQVQQASPSDPRQFVAKVKEDLKRLMVESSTADWIKNTYITDDTERNAASANERLLAYSSEAAKTATKFKDLPLDPDTSRMLYLLRIASPVIEDPARRLEMTSLAARLEGHYGAAKDAQGRDLEDLSKIVERSRDYDELLDALLGVYRHALDHCRPGACLAELDRLIRAGIAAAGFPDQPTHPIAHGVGARAHEPPYAHQAGGGTIEEGMVLAIEPGAYWAEGGGLRLEDNFLITADGVEKLSSYPDDFRQ